MNGLAVRLELTAGSQMYSSFRKRSVESRNAKLRAARAVQAECFAPLGKPHVLVNGDMGPVADVFESDAFERTWYGHLVV